MISTNKTYLILIFIFLPLCLPLKGAEQTAADTQPPPPQMPQKMLKFSINPESLFQSSQADEKFWLNVKENKLLVLKYWATGKIQRGNIILIHTQGEHADHLRLISPLAKQFSSLGWQVYLPNLPLEDYSQNLAQNIKKDTNANTQEETPTSPDSIETKTEDLQSEIPLVTHFFKDAKEFQSLFSNLIDELILQIQPKHENLLIMANENSAYWVLDSIKKNSAINKAVLLHPQLPINISENLEESFQAQKIPVLTFIQNEQQSSPFIKAFKRQLWQSNFQRLFKSSFPVQRIEPENNYYSKIITGWVKSQEKPN